MAATLLPVLQLYEVAPAADAVIVVLLPLQMVVVPEKLMEGAVSTVTVVVAVF